MRKLKLQVNITLDGFVAALDGRADWMTPPDDAGRLKVIELAASSDTLLLGRKMTQGFIEYWESVVDNQPDSPMYPLAQSIVNMRKIVFSRTQPTIKGRNLEVQNSDLATAVQTLKNEPGKDILVYGGASFVSSLINLDLIDEYYMIVNSVAIGNGLSIFKEKKVLKLDSSITFTNGKMLHKYLPA